MFVCATATKDTTIVNQLCIVNALSKFVPDILTSDPDMMSIALVSDTSTLSMSLTASGSLDSGRPRGVPRIGQVALLVELIDRLQQVYDTKDLTLVRLLWDRLN